MIWVSEFFLLSQESKYLNIILILITIENFRFTK